MSVRLLSLNRLLRRLGLCSAFGATLAAVPATAAPADFPTASPFVTTVSGMGAVPLAAAGKSAPIVTSKEDFPGVLRAAKDLAADFGRVTGADAPIVPGELPPGAKVVILAGTLGRHPLIDSLVASGRLDTREISGVWEGFGLEIIENPFPGVAQALVIMGADRRGTIFGIYELSAAIGVSPWYWWADIEPRKSAELYARADTRLRESPSVRYRGIFLNDEHPALSGWIWAKFGGAPVRTDPPVPAGQGIANYGHEFYERIFEVLLRLKGNYLWPAMWNNAFNEDDPENARLADLYGVVMGTSHQEPMMRAQKEWDRRYQDTVGSWNYAQYPDLIDDFWREGIQHGKDFESIVTMGLRGANDTEMAPGGPAANRALLERIVGRQREILAEVTGRTSSEIPQLWCLYKEVQEYYEDGMRVPDDVTLLWADDNWGNLRRLPSAEERRRSGGAGIYYHFDYHGGPRSYQWTNTSPIAKVWEQMSLAKQYGADRIWVVNVGHFKGYEYPTSFFMDLAWAPQRFDGGNLTSWTRAWAASLFGQDAAGEAAELLELSSRYSGRRKPELIEPETWSLTDDGEAERVLAEWSALESRAITLSASLPASARDGFYELVLFPIRSSRILNELYIAAGRNNLWARQGRATATAEAARVRALFADFQALADSYNHDLRGGKWDRFQDQTVIGYQAWNDPEKNNLDHIALVDVAPREGPVLGVAIEGSRMAWPGAEVGAALPQLDPYNRKETWLEIFNRGTMPFNYIVTSQEDWVTLSGAEGRVEGVKRIAVAVDWAKAPAGLKKAKLVVIGAGASVNVEVAVYRPRAPELDKLEGPIETDRYLAVEAEHFTRKRDEGNRAWTKVAGYGHTLSGMRASAELDAPRLRPGKDAPCLEYRAWFCHSGEAKIDLVISPVLNFRPGRDIRIAVGVDALKPEVAVVVPAVYSAMNGNADWEQSVIDNCRHVAASAVIEEPGYHTIKIWMIDPGPVLERFTVDLGGLRRTTLGPAACERGL